ncbi:HK97 family phage prohead protease [Achromobacter sp.]|uniref:HK97 family phage prohead protease n=1 Tax=Achromobacter sp. TaxID=134375 RepID=UPI000EEA6F4E|nr:HK97 family phage prohead protease [Achromobacter sp.]HCW20364.1 peptidase U35 [Achromobacter sp.]
MKTNHQTFLAVKALEREDGRWIEGWATTGREDRVGDIVVPEGAAYTLPIPLLFAHKHDEPIGSVVRAEITKAGIRIRAKLTEGVARADEVWRLVQDGALTAVSIGFQALKHSALPNGGLRFDKWEWHELSVVSVPANPDARISVAKCMAVAAKAAQPAPPRKKVEGFVPSEEFGTAVGEAILGATSPLARRIATLEKNLNALERQLGVTHD